MLAPERREMRYLRVDRVVAGLVTDNLDRHFEPVKAADRVKDRAVAANSKRSAG